MSLIDSFKNVFSNSTVETGEYWNRLTDEHQIGEIIEQSQNTPQLIYKHSYRCGVCRFSKSELENASDTLTSRAGMHFVDVNASRKVSNKIVEKFDVRHESPQALLVKNGEVVWHKSHGSIKADSLINCLQV